MEPGRNDPCPCGSGKKYKKCCRDKLEVATAVQPLRQQAQAPTPKLPVQQEMSALALLFNQQRYLEAELLARSMTARFPHDGFGWKVLGAALNQMGRNADALAAMQQAAAILPDDAEAHFNLGVTLQGLGRLAEAEISYRRVLEINPDSADAHCNLGVSLQALGRFAEAEANCRRALKINPDYAVAHYNLGITLKEMCRLAEAEASFRRALQINPNFVAAHSDLGNTLKEMGRLAEAESSYRRVLEIKPDYAEAHTNLGVTLQDLGRLDEAEASCRRALQIKPDLAEAHYNLGIILKAMGRLAEAEASFRQTLQGNPDLAEAHYNLGTTLLDMDRLDEAETCFRRALAIKPDYAEAHSNLGNALKDLGKLDDAVASYRQALAINPYFVEAHSNLLLTLNYLADQPATILLAEARRFGNLAARQAIPYTEWRNLPEPGRCLRVGLVSGDLRAHPVGYFLESALTALSAHAAGRLEFFAYHNHFCTDTVTERIKACCHGWHSVLQLSDEVLAQRIVDDGIDILIDLSGHTAHNRLPVFARKPAPIQAAWLGYFATTGVAAMDYLIADPWTLPEAEEIHFTEKIWRLPETRLCFTAPDVDVAVAPLPALANGYITFGCFNNLSKMNDDVVALWARVLASVPGSRLFLKAKQLNAAMVRQSVVERFADHGIGIDRMILEGFESRAKYLAAYQRVDIALDPSPFTGATTSAEGLWMGVPVLTLAGERFLSRQGIGLLMNAGLSEWIAADADDYVARAASHAGDLQRLASLRNGLRQQVLVSPIFDAPRFALHFEAALRGMWTQWCEQQGQPTL